MCERACVRGTNAALQLEGHAQCTAGMKAAHAVGCLGAFAPSRHAPLVLGLGGFGGGAPHGHKLLHPVDLVRQACKRGGQGWGRTVRQAGGRSGGGGGGQKCVIEAEQQVSGGSKERGRTESKRGRGTARTDGPTDGPTCDSGAVDLPAHDGRPHAEALHEASAHLHMNGKRMQGSECVSVSKGAFYPPLRRNPLLSRLHLPCAHPWECRSESAAPEPS